jgi:hypothetical protein
MTVEKLIQVGDAEKILEPVFRLFAHDSDTYKVIYNAAEIIGGVDAPAAENDARKRSELFVRKGEKTKGKLSAVHVTSFAKAGTVKFKTIEDKEVRTELITRIAPVLDYLLPYFVTDLI